MLPTGAEKSFQLFKSKCTKAFITLPNSVLVRKKTLNYNNLLLRQPDSRTETVPIGNKGKHKENRGTLRIISV